MIYQNNINKTFLYYYIKMLKLLILSNYYINEKINENTNKLKLEDSLFSNFNRSFPTLFNLIDIELSKKDV